MSSENIHSSNHANGFCFLSEGVQKKKCNRDCNFDYFLNVIVIDYDVILFMRNCNRAGGK